MKIRRIYTGAECSIKDFAEMYDLILVIDKKDNRNIVFFEDLYLAKDVKISGGKPFEEVYGTSDTAIDALADYANKISNKRISINKKLFNIIMTLQTPKLFVPSELLCL